MGGGKENGLGEDARRGKGLQLLRYGMGLLSLCFYLRGIVSAFSGFFLTGGAGPVLGGLSVLVSKASGLPLWWYNWYMWEKGSGS